MRFQNDRAVDMWFYAFINGIEYLNENLREVALARLANPDISLNELRLLLNNKISRAGIKYRLDKIIEIYQKIKSQH